MDKASPDRRRFLKPAARFVRAVTRSSYRDPGGPIDLIAYLGIGTLGAAGMAVPVYTLPSPARRRQAFNEER